MDVFIILDIDCVKIRDFRAIKLCLVPTECKVYIFQFGKCSLVSYLGLNNRYSCDSGRRSHYQMPILK